MLPEFTNTADLQQKIDAYFIAIQGEYHFEEIPAKSTKPQSELIRQKVWDRESQPATLCELILFLGFDSRQDFDTYEATGTFASTLKRGRLRVEAEYEKKLHFPSPAGAIFALKSLGWNDTTEKSGSQEVVTKLQIEVLTNGYTPASDESQVIL